MLRSEIERILSKYKDSNCDLWGVRSSDGTVPGEAVVVTELDDIIAFVSHYSDARMIVDFCSGYLRVLEKLKQVYEAADKIDRMGWPPSDHSPPNPSGVALREAARIIRETLEGK